MAISEFASKRLKGPIKGHPEEELSLHQTVRILGCKWRPIILKRLWSGELRFNQLRRLLPGITQRMLTLQLRALEQDGLIDRQVYTEPRAHVSYRLNALGVTLIPLIQSMELWGDSYCAAMNLAEEQGD